MNLHEVLFGNSAATFKITFLTAIKSIVVTFAWRHLKQEYIQEIDKAVAFRSAEGIIRQYALSDLCSYPADTFYVGGPIGDFWRTWYTDIEEGPKSFKLYTTGLYAYEFSMKDGSIVKKAILYENIRYWYGIILVVLLLAVTSVGSSVLLYTRICRKWRKLSPDVQKRCFRMQTNSSD